MPTDKIVTWNATAGRGKVKTLAFLPNAGTLDQILVKSSSADGDASWKTLSQAMVTSALADGSLSPTLIAQNTNNKFVTDAQISTWNAKISGVTLEENATSKSTGNTAINFSSGAYAIVSVVGKIVRYNVDVVTDNSRWLDTVTNPVATNLVKSKLDGKADWGHGHSWDSISGKPTEFNPTGHNHHWNNIDGKPFDFNGSSVSTNYWFNSKNGSVMEGMNYIGNINSEVISSNAVTTNELRLNNTPSYAKSSAPSGYLTLNGNRVVFVNSFN